MFANLFCGRLNTHTYHPLTGLYFRKSGRLTQKNSISQVFPSKEDLVHKWYGNGIFFQDSGFGQFSQEVQISNPGLAILHLLVPPVRSLPSRCRHHLAQRLRRPLQATGHGEPPNLTLAAGCRHHPAAERPVAAAGAHWKVCTRGNKRRSCTAPCSCRASCVLQAVAHTRSLATPGCFTTTVHRGSQVQVRGALSTRHCGLMCTLSAQRACCVCLRYARLRFPCSRCVHLLFVPLLCMPALCAFVRCVWCACAALTYTMRSSSTSPTTHP